MSATENALTLLAENRVALLAGRESTHAIVCGQTAWYQVVREADRIRCSCVVPVNRTCSHALAAGVLWHERELALGAGLVAA